MGFFDKILKGLGFEDDESQNQKVKKIKEKEKKEKSKPIFASFDLKQEEKPKIQKEERIENVIEEKIEQDIPTTSSTSLNIIKVQNQVEVQNVVDKIKNGEQVIINMSALTGQDLTRSLDFLTGAVYALNKTMQKVENAIFIIQ